MFSNAGLPAEMHELITSTVDDLLAGTGLDSELAVMLCLDAIEFARDYSSHHIGQRARNAAALLLELGCPRMAMGLRHELALACELAAIGAASRRTGS